jgi:acyl carrier protein
MPADTGSQIRKFITGRYPNASIGDNEDMFSLGFVNSLFAMELVMFLEKTFDMSIPNDELRIDNFRTIASMTGLVERRAVGAPAGSR